MKPIRAGSKTYIPVTEENTEQLRLWLMKEFGFEEIPIEMLKAAMDKVAKMNTINLLDLKMSKEDREEYFRWKKSSD